MAGLVPATNIKCYALKTMYETGLFPWHVEGDLTVEALTGGRYTFTERWKGVSVAKPVLFTGSCEIPGPGSFLSRVERLLSHFQSKDDARYPQCPKERQIALDRWQSICMMNPKLYPEAVKAYGTILER